MTTYPGLLVAYPGPQLTKLTGKPNHITYQTHLRELTESLGAHTTHLGGGQHGYIGALVAGQNNNALYNELTNTAPAFVVPVHPGANPDVLLPTATQHQISEANRIYERELTSFTNYHGHVTAAKTKFIEAVGASHFHSLKHHTTGFHNVTLAAAFTLYRNKFATPDPDDIDTNDSHFKTAYDPNTTVEETFASKKECQAFAHGTPSAITDATLLYQTKRSFTKSNIKEFNDSIDKFEARPAAEQTWTNLENDLVKAEKKYRQSIKETPSVGQAGYNTANAATESESNKENTNIFKQLPYCWTHGFNFSHNSRTCRFKCDGHKDEATIQNMMGGNNFIRRGRNEVGKPECWSNKLKPKKKNEE